MSGRSWKGATQAQLSQIRALLLRRGATEDKVLRSPHEAWRLRIDKAVFTAYRGGTLYCNGGTIPELPFLYKSVSEILGQA